jgi:hypothetical protein
MVENGDAIREAPAHIDQVFALNMGIFRIKYALNLLMNVTYHCSVAAALGLGGYFAATGRIEAGSVVAIVQRPMGRSRELVA